MAGLLDLLSWIDSQKRIVGDNLLQLATDPVERFKRAGAQAVDQLTPFVDAAARGDIAGTATGLLNSGVAPMLAGVMTYHGTPHKFDKFDLSKIGTGEGAQSYGHGMYFAENPQVAGVYKEALSKPEVADKAGNVIHKTQEFTGIRTPEQNAANLLEYAFASQSSAPYQMARDLARRSDDASLHKSTVDVLNKWQELGAKPRAGGTLYKQDLPDEVLPSLLQWDKPLSQQPAAVKQSVSAAFAKAGIPNAAQMNPDGQSVHAWLSSAMGGGKAASDKTLQARASSLLAESGIPGLSYLDAGSRGSGSGTMNHVIWDQGLLNRMKPIPVE